MDQCVTVNEDETRTVKTFTQGARVRVRRKSDEEVVILTFPASVRSAAEVTQALGGVAMARVSARTKIPINELEFDIYEQGRIGSGDVILDGWYE